MALNPNHDFELTPAKYLKTISILHLALMAGQVIFAIVALVQTKKIIINVRYMRDPLLFVVPIVAVGGFIAGNILFKRKLDNINKMASLKTKLMDYQSAFIIRLATLEGPSLFGIVAFLVTGQLVFLIISAIIIVYFFLLKPTKQNIEEALELNYPEKETFSQGNKVL